jgi:hypothetical protein
MFNQNGTVITNKTVADQRTSGTPLQSVVTKPRFTNDIQVAQLVERGVEGPNVSGSNPLLDT